MSSKPNRDAVMRVTDPIIDGVHAEWHVHLRGTNRTITFDAPHGTGAAASGDAILAACLLSAMASDADLEIDGQVSDRLLRATDMIQDIFLSWDLKLQPLQQKFHRVGITAARSTPSPAGDGTRGTACFFSGGLDSFYSVLKNHRDIDALIFVHGFDIALNDTELYDHVATRLTAAADQLGLPLLKVRTNLRSLGDTTGADWENNHGAALAAVAHFLSPTFSRVLVPSSWGYAQLDPWGSHPLVDPLWSSDRVEIIHDGAEANRLQKFRACADSAAARQHLRVCWTNPEQAYNCGKCEKCIRTSAIAQISGVADQFVTIPPVDAKTVARLHMAHSRISWEDILHTIQREGRHDDMERAIRKAIRWAPVHEAIDPIVNSSRATWAAAHPLHAVRRSANLMMQRVNRNSARS